jgi:hypothetical protein
MNRKHLLLALVAANVLFAFASVGAEGFFGWTLPPALEAYQRDKFSDFGLIDGLKLMTLGMIALFAFASWIGLATFWRHARGLFVFTLGLDILFRLVAGPSVRTSIGTAFQMMDLLVAGTIIGLVYFSDLAREFEGAKVPQRSSAWEINADRA